VAEPDHRSGPGRGIGRIEAGIGPEDAQAGLGQRGREGVVDADEAVGEELRALRVGEGKHLMVHDRRARRR